jgi:hypothetical protein
MSSSSFFLKNSFCLLALLLSEIIIIVFFGPHIGKQDIVRFYGIGLVALILFINILLLDTFLYLFRVKFFIITLINSYILILFFALIYFDTLYIIKESKGNVTNFTFYSILMMMVTFLYPQLFKNKEQI